MLSSIAATLPLVSADDDEQNEDIWAPARPRPPIQSSEQGGERQGGIETGHGAGGWGSASSKAFSDPMWNDPLVLYGKVADLSALELMVETGGFHLEQTNAGDHDNDGIGDLDDKDDDNDGIFDLIERFDGCFGTDPFDHDNDGILDEFDWDDDNDGILEGPIDYTQGADPQNVSTDRYVEPTAIHPWTSTMVGSGYLVDQNVLDHDNDGVPDEDPDGSGRESYDEDDDNDGQLDQFVWPCDFDGDGIQDYFDDDDDGDGRNDWEDQDPYNASISGLMSSSGAMWDSAVLLNEASYQTYSHSLRFIDLEAMYHPDDPAFTEIRDGDLDGDGIPNFLDPDNDNDGTPDSVDTDDDNDGILDMYDPDDDNDGIKDVCLRIDNNGDGQIDYPVTGALETIGTDCELDYDRDQDDDRWRQFDQDYDLVWDWFDTDLGGIASPDNPLGPPSWDINDEPWDLDNDGIENENDSFPMNTSAVVAAWNCPTPTNKNPLNPDLRCQTERKSYVGNNDWDNDGMNNWIDMDDDNDGVPDFLDIDWNCDLDDDDDLHQINGSRWRDDGDNSIDTDIDGDGLANDVDWDDDNDGINDLFDPDDGNCGILDTDQSDIFNQPYYPVGDGGDLDGRSDGQLYGTNMSEFWNMSVLLNPFTIAEGFVLPYNGFDGTVSPVTNGRIPEFYWYYMSRGNEYNGGNYADIDGDGDSLINGLDVDQDADGLPDWWDQDENNDGLLDVDDFRMGGTADWGICGWTTVAGYACGLDYSKNHMLPLDSGSNMQHTRPYSTRPDASFSQGNYDGANSGNTWQCTAASCWHFEFNSQVTSAVEYDDIAHNRDLMVAWIGLGQGLFSWNSDNGPDQFFPDEFADMIDDDVDPDDDCGAGWNSSHSLPCMFNDTADLDDDFDGLYDHWDVDDDNDGIWDYFEIDTDDDWDDDANTMPPGTFFIGDNCEDNDDDGTDTDPDGDGWFQSVWDKGVLGQGLLFPEYYDVDNDNDGIPDGEDPDDDNNGVLDVVQDLTCFVGEEQSPYDHDNDGIPDWADDDWDADGRSNSAEMATATPWVSPWDHDDDGIRDDIDLDDDQDGMEDEDEIMLWPTRYDTESTNPWDHDDFGGGVGIAHPTNSSRGPDAIDDDDDNDTHTDPDFDHLEQGQTDLLGNVASDWDSDNDGILDEDDKIATRINMSVPEILWIDSRSPAIFSGSVAWLGPNGTFEPAPMLPVQVHLVWTMNGTSAVETIDVLTNAWGSFTVGQFLFPEDVHVGDNTTYTVHAEVTEMFIHDSSVSDSVPVEVRANTTIDYVAWNYFRSDEQPLWLDFKAHYTADWERGIYDKRIIYAPMVFQVSGGPFGNRSTPTLFDASGQGFRTDESGYASVTFVQESGNQGAWKQVSWNSTLSNGAGILPGGYEEVIWNNFTKEHDVLARYDYTNTSLPIGDYEFVGRIDTNIAADPAANPQENPWEWMEGDETDTFFIRSMHRMYVEADIIVPATNPVYYWDAQVFTGSSYGAWRALFSEPGLMAAGFDTDMSGDLDTDEFAIASVGKSWSQLWDGDPASLLDEAARLRPFLQTSTTDWFIRMQNGGDFDVPPCGPIDASDPDSPVRCEIIPEMHTGETYRVIGEVMNRTFTPWPYDPMALQVDLDHDGIFAGRKETGYAETPVMSGGKAAFDYNWTWYTQYEASTYGVRVDFTNSNYYFTGNQTNVLAPTGAYVNVSVIGTSSFELQTLPRLYRGQNTTVEARLIDNALQPVRDTAVGWIWSANGSGGLSRTDLNGIFKIDLNITQDHELGNFSLDFSFPGDSRLMGSTSTQEMWVVSRTFVSLQSTTPNLRSSGEIWEFTAQVTDDNRTPVLRDRGEALDGNGSDGGDIIVIFEGIDFDNRQHRQIMAVLQPNAGTIHHQIQLDPQLLKDDQQSFLPNGFGPVNVYLRFEENLPHEGCQELDELMLLAQGAWDPCTQIPNSEHFRREMRYNVDGFSLIGRTSLAVDDQIVYTSEVDPNTGLVIEKPMTITGRLTDELGGNLTHRSIRISYEMQGSTIGINACDPGETDDMGYYEIVCPLQGVMAGQARVTVQYLAYDNNDAYRYQSLNTTRTFPVFSNSTLQVLEVGPFLTDVDSYTYQNGSVFPVLYLKEPFHVNAILAQSNGNTLGGKCLNIYLDPESNARPIAAYHTADESGLLKWYSGDPEMNPSRRGVEPDGDKLEGFRTLRVAYEPKLEVPGGCRPETNAVVNGSFMDVSVLVRSRVDIILHETWARPQGYQPGEIVSGEIQIMRDRMPHTVEGETILFIREYWNGTDWLVDDVEYVTTDERGIANFTWTYTGEVVPGADEEGIEAVNGMWRINVHFRDSPYFQEAFLNNTPELKRGAPPVLEESAGIFQMQYMLPTLIALMFMMLIGAVMWKRYSERRRIEILRGILTDSLMALQASNEYIQVIFNCYKDLVRFFRSRGAMKKVYETTREFEDAVHRMLGGITAPEELSGFLSIFEEARYSDHQIGAAQRDRAIATLQGVVNSLSIALGESLLARDDESESSLYTERTKAGEFVDSEGKTRLAGIDEDTPEGGFSL